MIRYNYRPSLSDHAQILILVRPFFNTSDTDFSFVLKKLNCFKYAQFKDCEDRRILLKFTKGYSRDTLEWGRLQIHRRPLGFIGIAVLSSDEKQHSKDYEKIEHRYGNLISQYDSYLYDSRCIIIGPDAIDISISRKDFFYLPVSTIDVPEKLIEFLNEFVSSIFVILESKRVDKVTENFERMVLPTAPIEQEQTITDSDTRFMKRKFIGRNKKVLGDLTLVSGLYREAMLHYLNAYEHLSNVNDHLWIGSALEGICAASNAVQVAKDTFKPNDLVLTIAKSSVNDNVTNDNNDERIKTCVVLTTEEMISKYNECLSCYKRFSPLGPVDIEAHFKFIRVLLKVQNKIKVAQVVQSLLMIPINYNEVEKIELSVVLGSIHEQSGLFRKAAFFRRRAALCYYNLSSISKLSQAMSLLREVAPSYKLDIENPVMNDDKEMQGWPTVQLQILQDMLQVSKKLGNKLDCVRLLCYILERYRFHLNWVDHTELVDMLEEYSDSIQSLANEENKGTNIKLIRPIPIIRNLQPKRLAHHLQPFKAKTSEQHGPFIFSSLSSKSKGKDEENVYWVSGDVAEVDMVVDNPLPVEIKVSNMTLLTDGVSFEAYPATLALPAQSGSYPFMLLGTPKCQGNLVIKGYRLEVLGVTNTVMLPKPISVAVTPALPILKLNSTLPRSPAANSLNPEDEDYQTLFTSANLYRGHSCNGKLTIENAGVVAISVLDIKLKNPTERGMVFNTDCVSSKLPLMPGDWITLNVTVMPAECWQFHNKADKIQVTLLMTYSCVEENDDGYTRKVNWITNVSVMPSLEFTNIQFSEIERHPGCCCISFDATNMTSVAMNVSCKVKNIDREDVAVDTSCGCFERHKLELPSKKKTFFSLHFPRIALPKPSNKRQTYENMYSKFVRESISFEWKLSDTNYNGITYFRDVEVNSDAMKVLKPRHLDITICVNNRSVVEGEVVLVNECDLVNISIVLSNRHDKDIENMILYVSPHQECFRSNDQMNQLCLPSGSLYKVVKKLSPGETFEHTCGLLFLYEGKYIVDICSSANQKFGTRYSSNKRQRAFAVIEEKSVESSILTPYSPRTVLQKLQMFDEEFWAHSFVLNVSTPIK